MVRKFCSLVIVLVSLPILSAHAVEKCRLSAKPALETLRGNPLSDSADIATFEAGDTLVDAELGFLRLLDKDDVSITVAQIDFHLSSHVARSPYHAAKVRLFTNLATPRVMAKVPSPESIAIIQSRIGSTYTLPVIERYFALYRLIELALSSKLNVDPQIIEKLLIVTNRNRSKGEGVGVGRIDVKSALAIWTQVVFNDTKDRDEDSPTEIDALLEEAQRVTGENLVRSGILSTLALLPGNKGYIKWSWPTGLKKEQSRRLHSNHLSPTHRRLSPARSVPMDIDHFSRSTLWKQQEAFVAPLVFASLEHLIEALNQETIFQNSFRSEERSILMISESGEFIQLYEGQIKETFASVEITVGSDPYLENKYSGFWKRLLSAATSEMTLPELSGKDVVVLKIKGFDEQNILSAEVTRRAYNSGARFVQTIVIEN